MNLISVDLYKVWVFLRGCTNMMRLIRHKNKIGTFYHLRPSNKCLFGSQMSYSRILFLEGQWLLFIPKNTPTSTETPLLPQVPKSCEEGCYIRVASEAKRGWEAGSLAAKRGGLALENVDVKPMVKANITS